MFKQCADKKQGGGGWADGERDDDGENRELRGGWRGRAGRMTSFPQLPCADRALASPSAHGGCCWGSDSSCRTQTRPDQPALLGWIKNKEKNLKKQFFNPAEETREPLLDWTCRRDARVSHKPRGLLLCFNHEDVRVYKLGRKKQELRGWQKR